MDDLHQFARDHDRPVQTLSLPSFLFLLLFQLPFRKLFFFSSSPFLSFPLLHSHPHDLFHPHDLTFHASSGDVLSTTALAAE